MKEQFIDWSPLPKSIKRLQKIESITDKFESMGFRLSLRQLYYQLLSRKLIENEPREYKNLGSLISKARLAGLMDWDIIEDRGRQPHKHAEWDNIHSIVETAIESYRLPRWSDQRIYIELWCEKDALSSILKPITDELHVTLMVNKGYSLSSAMYEASKRFIDAADAMDVESPCILLYLGDFDPSGEDMVRDIRARLSTFGAIVYVQKLALTQEQIDRYDLPTNNAKRKDSRASEFIKRHGKYSYEVDALRPDVLQSIVRNGIRENMDWNKYTAWIKREKRDSKLLIDFAKKMKWKSRKSG